LSVPKIIDIVPIFLEVIWKCKKSVFWHTVYVIPYTIIPGTADLVKFNISENV